MSDTNDDELIDTADEGAALLQVRTNFLRRAGCTCDFESEISAVFVVGALMSPEHLNLSVVYSVEHRDGCLLLHIPTSPLN